MRDASGLWKSMARARSDAPHVAAWMSLDNGTTVLSLRNATFSRLTYVASMRGTGQASWQETDVAPVLPGLLGFETWPYQIDELAIVSVRFD